MKALKFILLVISMFAGSSLAAQQITEEERKERKEIDRQKEEYKLERLVSGYRDQAKEFDAAGEIDSALAYYTKCIELQPKDGFNYWFRGYIYENRGELDNAFSDYSKGIEVDPKEASLSVRRGILYFKRGEPDKAFIDFSNAIKNDKENSDAIKCRGWIYDSKGEYDKADAEYKKAQGVGWKDNAWEDWFGIEDLTGLLKLYPKFRIGWVIRGSAYNDKGENDKAILDFNKAISLDGKCTYAWIYRGIAYHDKGEYDNAIEDFNKVIQIDVKRSGVWRNRGLAYYMKGEYDKAIINFKEALRLNGESRYAYINIISPLARKGHYDLAKTYYNTSKSKDLLSFLDDEKWGFFKYYLTAVTENIPDKLYEEALVNLNIALKEYETQKENTDKKEQKEREENKSGYIDILALKGYVLQNLNRNDEANDVYNQALVLNKNQPEVKEALAAINKKQEVIAKTDNTAPVIELISPETKRGLNIVSAREEVRLVGRAKDASGIAELNINGKTIKAEDDGLFVSALTIKSGENTIVISATDKQGNTANKTFTLTGNQITKKELPVIEQEIIPVGAAIPTYHAILIAGQDYNDGAISDLENPIKDAKELRSILQNNYTFDAKNIDTFYNSSREDILQSIMQKSASLGENDNLIIFYAGHGIAEKDKFGDVDGYWIPSSAKKGNTSTYISSEDINKSLKRSNAKHILVIADACFSGAFTRELPTDASVGVQKQYSVPSRKIMASGNMEPVPDNSRFIFYLKKNLKENKEKYLTSKKLFDSFYEAILNNSDTSPQYAAIKNVGDEGGEFVFIKK